MKKHGQAEIAQKRRLKVDGTRMKKHGQAEMVRAAWGRASARGAARVGGALNAGIISGGRLKSRVWALG